jgi:hypothetical protein
MTATMTEVPMSEPEPRPCPGVPDACPKGHQIWWFIHGRPIDANERRLHWGLCSGKMKRDGFLVIEGDCRHVWLWDERQLRVVYEFNAQVLAEQLRKVAHQIGVFTTNSVTARVIQDD